MQRDGWQLSQLAREAVKNVFAPRSRLYVLVVLAVAIGVVVPLYSAWESVQLDDQLQRESLQGRNALLITAVDRAHHPAEINRRSCENLARDSEVIAAGIVQQEGTADFPQLGAGIPILAASPTLLPQLSQNSAIVGDALRSAGPDFELLMPDGTALNAIVGPKQPELIGSNSAVTVNLPPNASQSDSCDVILSPLADENTTSRRLVTEIQSTGGPIIASQAFSEPESPIDVFLSRPERFLPLLLALSAALAAGTLNRLRTGEWAAYRMSGTSPRSLFIIMLLEQATVAGLFVTVSAVTTLAVSSVLVAPIVPVFSTLAGGGIWVVGTVLLSFDLPLRAPASLAKDR